MDVEYYVNDQEGRVYTGQMAVNDRVATPDEVAAHIAAERKKFIMAMVMPVYKGMTAMAYAQREGITDYDLLTKVKALVAASDDPAVQIAWDKATEWRRTSPLLNAIAAALGLTDDQMDRLFLLAAKIEA